LTIAAGNGAAGMSFRLFWPDTNADANARRQAIARTLRIASPFGTEPKDHTTLLIQFNSAETKRTRATAGPSTLQVAKSATCFAQDDSIFCGSIL
jgi:hypothetical protein